MIQQNHLVSKPEAPQVLNPQQQLEQQRKQQAYDAMVARELKESEESRK